MSGTVENNPTVEDSAAPGSGDRALRQRVQRFVDDWRTTLGKNWQSERADALYEDLERLAAEAEAQSAIRIAGPALELVVYLCSFVDGAAIPNASQRQGLDRQIETLAAASGETAVRRTARKSTRSDETTHRQAFYLRSAERDMPGLAAALGRQHYIVRPFESTQNLLHALEDICPDVLLIDDAFASEIHALSEAAQSRRPAHKDTLLCLVLGDEIDNTHTLFAQRAGADAIVNGRDPVVVIARMDELWAQRRALGYRVLIVEDDAGQAKFCESILRHRGVITSVCEDPARVPAVIEEFKPDLVLLDLYLPGSNGIEVAQGIRNSGQAFLPIVFLSGELDPDLRFDAIRVGADDFITKPVKPRHLVTTVESRIKRARQLNAPQSDRRGERRGTLSGRDVLAREIVRSLREEQERCPALAMIVVDDVDSVQHSIGFSAGGVLAQQLAAALAAEIHGARTLCACGELKFLVLLHAEDELQAREQFQTLRQTLEARAWLSDELQVRLHFSIGASRLNPDMADVDAALDRVRALLAKAEQAGGACGEYDLRVPRAPSNEDPRLRMVRAILRAPSVRETAQFDFQPLISLSGQIVGQYEARMILKPPKSSQALALPRRDYLAIARKLDLVAHADRHQLRGIIELVRDKREPGQELRLHVPVAVESLFDPAFAPWLAAELGANAVPSNVLALEFDAGEARDQLARLRSALDSLQRVGVRLVLDANPADGTDIEKLLAVNAFSSVKLRRGGDATTKADAAWEPWSGAINNARTLGKIVVAADIAGIADLSVLLRLGVHYVQGDALCTWLPGWTFDFSEAVS
ncbi:MAG: response regulator [Rudaea sp.]